MPASAAGLLEGEDDADWTDGDSVADSDDDDDVIDDITHDEEEFNEEDIEFSDGKKEQIYENFPFCLDRNPIKPMIRVKDLFRIPGLGRPG